MQVFFNMENLCNVCYSLKDKKDLNIFEDYCKSCKKHIRTTDPEFYKKEYQRLYRNNKIVINKNPILRKEKKERVMSIKKKSRSRIYICKVGANRVKIGATHVDSLRLYSLEDKLNLIDVPFQPLFYFDCQNHELITKIETDLKELYCNSEIGININSFKNEMAHFSKLDEIYSFIEDCLEKSGFIYSIVTFRY